MLGRHSPFFNLAVPVGVDPGESELSLLIQSFMSLAIVGILQIIFYQWIIINVFQKSDLNNLRELVWRKFSTLRGLKEQSNPKKLSILWENSIKHNER